MPKETTKTKTSKEVIIPKKKMGRPSKYSDKQVFAIIELLAPEGFTDKEMARIMGVTEQTFNNWKKTNKVFFESLNKAKGIPNRMVERRLFQKAMGYEDVEEQIFHHKGKIIKAPLRVKYPPDTGAIMAWLNNRMPEVYRNQLNVKMNAPDEFEDILKRFGSWGQRDDKEIEDASYRVESGDGTDG